MVYLIYKNNIINININININVNVNVNVNIDVDIGGSAAYFGCYSNFSASTQ